MLFFSTIVEQQDGLAIATKDVVLKCNPITYLLNYNAVLNTIIHF